MLDSTRPVFTKYCDVFAQLPEAFLKSEILPLFDVNIPEYDVWAYSTAHMILEEMFATEVSGAASMLKIDTWMSEYGIRFCELNKINIDSLNMETIQNNVVAYYHAAFKLQNEMRARQNEMHLHASYTHPNLGIEFNSLIEINKNIIFVSLHEAHNPAMSYLYHRIASCFDPRKRYFVHEYVMKMKETQLDLMPEIGGNGEALWRMARGLAVAANKPIERLLVAFDLEWHNMDRKTRFTDGQIVDAHFEDVTNGWVIHTGIVKPYPQISQLSPFLIDHGYTNEMLEQGSTTLDSLRHKINNLHYVSPSCITIAFNGINSDISVLANQGIHLSSYIDSTFFLTKGLISHSLSTVFKTVVGNLTFDAHHARGDTQALIAIMKRKGITFDKVKEVHDIVKTCYI